MASNQNTIGDIYKSVIQDVINNMKEAFLDENIDVDILAQLKKEWEDKIKQSGAVDVDTPMQPVQQQQRPAHVQPPPMRTPQPQQQSRMPPIRVQQQPQHNMNDIRTQYTQQPMPAGLPIRMFQQPGGQQQYMVPQLGQQQILLMNQAGHQVPMVPGQIRNLPPHMSQMNQLDGNADFDEGAGSSSVVKVPKKCKKMKKIKIRGEGATDKEALEVLGAIMKEMQLDGGGGGMSDSSSEDENEDEDDPLRRIANNIGNDNVADDPENAVDDEPLNSGDDQSDDEDTTALFDAENVVMCQFEKVNRARTKWKFQLKDGIMHIEKKDYCFQKCSGEAEW